MNKINWGIFDIIDSDGDRPALAALCGFFYFAAGVHDVARELADGVERYVEYVGLETLKSYAAKSGNWKAMTKGQLKRDLYHLLDFPQDHVAFEIEYDSGYGGEPGSFGVYIDADEDDSDFDHRTQSTHPP